MEALGRHLAGYGFKNPRVIDPSPIGLTKKLSAQACQSDSLTQSILHPLKTLRESKIRAKGRGEERGALNASELFWTKVGEQ